MTKPIDPFREAMAEIQKRAQPNFDPGAAAEALDQMVDVIVGLRAKLAAQGFSETAAEQMCVQMQYAMCMASV